MRLVGLIALLGGCLILLQPHVRQYVHYISIPANQTNLLGGALICLGVAAIWISRSRE